MRFAVTGCVEYSPYSLIPPSRTIAQYMLTGDTDRDHMPRAFLTDGERAAVADDPEMDASTKSSHLSRVRGKIGRLKADAQLLREHRPEMYEPFRDAVVEEELDERIERLEQEVAALREQLDEE